ncbi:MAG: aminotransferase class IV [Gammaproteobacteria bacterium]|nr:aminotransferase class IV [Gammaproteobacteria bacterium]MDH3449131.1 aminotransferase class IV [Gammaproteobacteria bacterium]
MTDFSKGVAYIEGEYVAIAEAKIPLMDWGFLHSDATYDVAHTWKGRFFRVDEYIDRFQTSMAKLRMSVPYGHEQIREVMFELVRLTGLRDTYVEIVCTRGIPAPGSRDPRDCSNRFLAFAVPFVWIADDEKRETGLNLLISRQQRIPPESVDPTIKNYHWLDMVMALFEAYDHGADTAILVDARGDLTEGPGFNIFARHGDTVTSPEHGVLHGVTRLTLLELLERENLQINRGRLPADAARAADEVFITSTAGGVMPVTRIDGKPVGEGRPGTLVHKLNDAYWALHEDPDYSVAISY